MINNSYYSVIKNVDSLKITFVYSKSEVNLKIM